MRHQKKSMQHMDLMMVVLLAVIFGCVPPASQTQAKPNPTPAPAAVSAPALQQVPRTLAILPFENNSVTDAEQYAPLSKGIPAMLITDLKKAGTSLKLIERSKIQSLFKETAMGQTGVTQDAAVQAGKLLGAEAITFGSFIVLGNQVRIDSRIIGTETSEVIMAESITGKSDNFMELVQELGMKIAQSLQVTLKPDETGTRSDIDAALYFSKGLDALDRNDRAEAGRLFQMSIDRDPAYRAQVDNALAGERPGAASPEAPASGPALEAGGETVEAEGISFTSRDDAVRQAQRAAVEQAVGVFVQTRTEMENFQVKKEQVFSQTQGYIKRFEILDEKQAGDQYTVRIRAQVSLEKIKDDLMAMKILLDSMEHPKIMILIQEAYSGMADMGMNLAETEMTGVFKAKGFDVVDKAQVENVRSNAQARQALDGNTDAAQSLGLTLGAQYAVVGKGVVEDIGEAYAGSGLKSLQASLQLRVIQTQSGKILGSVVKNGVAAHASAFTGASQALRKAAQKAFDEYLADTITHSFQDFLNNGAPIKLYVTGVSSFQEYKAVAAAVEGMEKIVSAQKEGWNKAGGAVVLDLKFKGTSGELAEALDGKKAGGKAFHVTDFAPDRVDCNYR